jgi:hypothetical protein
LLISLLSIVVLGYHCGAQQACAESSWWLAPLTWGEPYGRAFPAYRSAARIAQLSQSKVVTG